MTDSTIARPKENHKQTNATTLTQKRTNQNKVSYKKGGKNQSSESEVVGEA